MTLVLSCSPFGWWAGCGSYGMREQSARTSYPCGHVVSRDDERASLLKELQLGDADTDHELPLVVYSTLSARVDV